MREDVVKKTVASYDEKWEEYISNTDKLSYFPDLPAMLDMFVGMLPGKKVLDVAFGSGRDTLYLIEQGLDVQGIELAQMFIDTLCAKVNIPLYKMDMRELKFEDNTFDGIWCCSSFLHLPREDALPTLKGFRRVLRPRGVLYLELKEGEGEDWVSSPTGYVKNTLRFFTYYKLEEICGLLQEVGFEVKFARTQPDPKYSYKHNWLNILSVKAKDSVKKQENNYGYRTRVV